MNGDAVSAEAPVAGLERLARFGRELPARFLAYVWDNPSAEQDARTILSSPKVGMWLGLEILLLLAACAFSSFALPEWEDQFRGLAVSVGTAPYLVSSVLIMLTAFLTLFVPLRASGLLEGPRWRGYLDQLVTTGVSPLRYYAGKWATSQPYFLALLGASLPFVVLFGLLGDISWGRTAVSYVLLYGYCNLLLLVAFGLGAVLHEVIALLLTWNLFSLFVVLEFMPLPSSLAAMTPIRFLIQPFVEPLAGAQAAAIAPLYMSARPFGLDVPWPVWALGLWGLLCLVVLVTCTLGPLHTYVPGLNNFGAVVLPGDRKRVFFRRMRPFLNRRVELAFLFENRGPRLIRWTLPLRSLQQLALLGLLSVMLYSVVFDPTLVKEFRRQGVIFLHGFMTTLLLLISGLVFSSGRIDGLQRFRLGPYSIPQVVFDAGTFFCFLGGLVAMHAVGFAVSWTSLVQSRSSWWARISPEEVFANCSSNLGVLIAVAISTFLVLKVVGTKVLGRGWVFLSMILYLLALLLLPLLAFVASDTLRRADNPLLARMAAPLFAVAEMSPALQIAVDNEGLPSWVKSTSWVVRKGFWFWHLPWIGFLSLMVMSGHRSVVQEAKLLGEGYTAPPPAGAGPLPPPCGECRSRRRVAVGWTWWGGLLGTRVMGTVRCLDCRTEYSPRTGQPDYRVAFLFFGLRLVLVAIGLWVVATLLVQVAA